MTTMTRSEKAFVARFAVYGLLSAAFMVACGGDDDNPAAGGTGGTDASPVSTGGRGGTGGTGAEGGSPTGGTGAVGTGGDVIGTGGILEAGVDASVEAGVDAAVDAPAEAAPVNLDAGEAGNPCPGVLVDVTSEGTATATSTYSQSDAQNGVDGLTDTSWWVASTFGSETFTWTLPADECIGRIQITNTAADAFQSGAWAGWGFGQVIVRVRNAGGDLIDERTIALSAEPDPAVDVNFVTLGLPVQGRTVELEFSGFPHNYGGFSELTVSAIRVPPPPTDGAVP